MNSNKLKDLITRSINNTKFTVEIGYVMIVQNGMVVIKGLPNLQFEELVTFANGIHGLVLSLETDYANIIVLGDFTTISTGMEVYATGKFFTVKVNDNLIGEVLNGFGEPLKPIDLTNAQEMVVDRPAPAMLDRQAITSQIITGIRAIDWLNPIALGQRSMIIGDRFVGKSTLAIDTIINLKDEPIVSIYVVIGQRKDASASVWKTLKDNGVNNVIMLVANASDPMSMRYLAPFVAASIGEYFRDNGKHALVFFDDLNQHAITYREIALLLKQSPGREAYPGDIFYLHSRLLERATMLNAQLGGGSLTIIPVVTVSDNDIATYIGTNILSIVDGQLVLDSDKFKRGEFPAINVGLSVSRIGTHMQCGALRHLCKSIKVLIGCYLAFQETQKFSVDSIYTEQEQMGELLVFALTQELNKPDKLWQQLIILYGIIHKHLTSKQMISNMQSKLTQYEDFVIKIMEEKDDITTPTIASIYANFS